MSELSFLSKFLVIVFDWVRTKKINELAKNVIIISVSHTNQSDNAALQPKMWVALLFMNWVYESSR